MRLSRNNAAVTAGGRDLEEALDRLSAILAAKGLRLTKARVAIVEAALAREGHFPIDELVQDLRRRGIRGSKATVYRALPLLAEAGILQPAVFESDSRRYEASFGKDHHDHLVCSGCGKVIEFELEAFEVLQREVAARHGFTLESHHHQLVGRCGACRAAPAVADPADPREGA